MMKAAHSALLAAALGAATLAGCATGGPWTAWGNSDQALARVEPGMTKQDVQAALGPPRETMRFPLSGNEAWTWYGQDTWGYYTEYSVTFTPSGRVASTTSRRINEGGDHR